MIDQDTIVFMLAFAVLFLYLALGAWLTDKEL